MNKFVVNVSASNNHQLIIFYKTRYSSDRIVSYRKNSMAHDVHKGADKLRLKNLTSVRKFECKLPKICSNYRSNHTSHNSKCCHHNYVRGIITKCLLLIKIPQRRKKLLLCHGRVRANLVSVKRSLIRLQNSSGHAIRISITKMFCCALRCLGQGAIFTRAVLMKLFFVKITIE